MSAKKRAALLGRTSGRTGNQEESIETQRHILEEFAGFLDYEIAGFYLDEGVQSSVPVRERPEGHRLYTDAHAGEFEVVLVYRIDRISRYRDVFYRFLADMRAADIGLRSRHDSFETESPQGRLMLNILLDFAEFERDSIVQRVMDGKVRTALANAHLGGPPPYGFRVAGHKPRFLVPHETTEEGWAEAEMVRLMFGLAVNRGVAPVRIAEQLNAMGVPIPGAAPCRWRKRRGAEVRVRPTFRHGWLLSTVAKLLRDPLYRGVRAYNVRGRLVEQEVPALVTSAVWEEARRLTLGRRLHHGPSRRQYLLSGKLRCCGETAGGPCGHSWSGATTPASYVRQDGTKGEDRRYYVCIAKQSANSCAAVHRCTMPSVRQDTIEADCWAILEERLRNIDETLLQVREAQGGDQSVIDSLVRRRDAVLAQRDSLIQERTNTVRLLARGMFTEEEGGNLLATLRAELEAVQRTLTDITHEEEALQQRNARLDRAAANMLLWQQRLGENLTWQDKREAVQDLVDEVLMFLTEEGELKARYRLVFDCPISPNSSPPSTHTATIWTTLVVPGGPLRKVR